MYTITKQEITGKSYNAQALALQALLLPALLSIISALGFFVNIPITSFHFLLALAATIGASYLIVKKHHSFKVPDFCKSCDFRKVTLVFILIIIISFVISVQFYDFTQDGQAYHQPAVIALKKGWNPFHEPFLEKHNPFYKQALVGNELYVDHYPKASWITAASIFKLTGLIESGKLFNFLYLAALFLITWNFLFHFRRIPGKSKLLISALVALNPVILYQLSSFYNDGQLAALISITLILVFQYIMFREEKTLYFLFITLLILSNIKFTGLIYGAVAVALAWLTVFIIDRDIQFRFILTMGVAFIIAVVFIGFQPYITNIITKGNPFYPAVRIGGAGQASFETVLSRQAPEAFMKKNRFEKLYYSLFSCSDNDLSHMPGLKIPFYIGDNEMSAFNYVDARYGGFGPLFGSVLILVIAASFIVLFKVRRLVTWFSLIPAASILILTFLNPEAWWARLSPQLWLLPITFIASFYYFHNEYMDYFRGFVISLLLLNSVIVMVKSAGNTLTQNRQFNRQIDVLYDLTHNGGKVLIIDPDVFYLSTQNRLLNLKIKHRMVQRAVFSQPPVYLFGTPNVTFCIEGIASPGARK